MSVTLTEESEGLIVVQIKGIFTFDDLKEVQSRGRDQIDRSGKVKLLILA